MKKMISCVLVATLFFSIVALPTFANAGDTDVCGVYGEEALVSLTPDMQLQNMRAAIIANANNVVSTASAINTVQEMCSFIKLTEAERTAIVRASMQANITSQPAGVAASSSLPAYRVGIYVPHYKQETTYWCGPATGQQTVIALEIRSNGLYRPTQAEVAQAIGTTTAGSSTTNIASWLATKGYPYYSVPVNSMSYQDIENYVYSAIKSYQKPCFGGITVPSSNLGSWHYSTGGHILNVSAIYYDGVSCNNDYFEFTDPYITWVKPEITSGKYIISIDEYDRVMTSFWW